jgi:cell division protein FtsB
MLVLETTEIRINLKKTEILRKFVCRKNCRLMWKKIPSFLKNKYLLITIIFVVLLLFFDDSNIILQYEQMQQLNAMKTEKEFYQKEILKNKTLLNEMLSDSLTIEKFARETYLMKKDSEDVYVIERDSTEFQ